MKKILASLGLAAGLAVALPSVASAQDPPPQNCEYTDVIFVRNTETETYTSLRDMPTLQAGDGISMAVYFEEDGNSSWHSCQFGMALYSHPDNTDARPHLEGELVDYQDHGTAWKNGPALFYHISIPDNYCGLQLDAYRGKHLTIKDFQNGDRYGERLISAKNQTNGDPSCNPPVTTLPPPTTNTTEGPPNTEPPPTTTPETTVPGPTSTSTTDAPVPTTIDPNPTTTITPTSQTTVSTVSSTTSSVRALSAEIYNCRWNPESNRFETNSSGFGNRFQARSECEIATERASLAVTGSSPAKKLMLSGLLLVTGSALYLAFRHRHRVS